MAMDPSAPNTPPLAAAAAVDFDDGDREVCIFHMSDGNTSLRMATLADGVTLNDEGGILVSRQLFNTFGKSKNTALRF